MATTTRLSPFDAIRQVTVDADCKSAKVNRFGIGFGQRGYAGNQHFPTLEALDAAWEARLAELREIYGRPAKNWTGRYLEENLPIAEGSMVFRRVRFVPLRKDGRHGKTIHSLYAYPIDVTQDHLDALSAALKVPVS